MNKRLHRGVCSSLIPLLLSVCADAQSTPLPPSSARPETNAASDPLLPLQWHLKNIGQTTIGDVPPTPGIDLNLGSLYENGITGKGVTVGIRDAGPIDTNNEDLTNNLAIKSTPVAPNAHATAIAGIIGAIANNGIGGRGIAPEVQILDLTRENAHSMPTPKVINISQLTVAPLFPPTSLAEIDKENLGLRKRDKSLHIFSASNAFLTIPATGGDGICAQATKKSGVTCLSASTSPLAPFPNAIYVAAVNANGIKSSYSSTGSVVLVSAFGGEHGEQKSYLRQAGYGEEDIARMPAYKFSPAIVTTDVVGCGKGAKVQGNNFFDDRGAATALNPLCNYTASANGTSSAAPMVTGVAALMLQVNPELSWREIRYILATTARPLDLGRSDLTYEGATIDNGWTKNAAGHLFSNAYGFGLVDATRAVNLARNFAELAALEDTGWATYGGGPVAIPFRDASHNVAVMNVDRQMKIEMVQIRLKTTHPSPNNLRVAVISPSGTVSTVLPALTAMLPTPQGFTIDLSGSNAFLDESSKGQWKIAVIDVLESKSPEKYSITEAAVRILGRHQ